MFSQQSFYLENVMFSDSKDGFDFFQEFNAYCSHMLTCCFTTHMFLYILLPHVLVSWQQSSDFFMFAVTYQTINIKIDLCPYYQELKISDSHFHQTHIHRMSSTARQAVIMR